MLYFTFLYFTLLILTHILRRNVCFNPIESLFSGTEWNKDAHLQKTSIFGFVRFIRISHELHGLHIFFISRILGFAVNSQQTTVNRQ